MNLIECIIKNKSIIIELAFNDFKKRFVGSYFGILWMFIQPTTTVLVYTLVFQVGFRAVPPVSNLPYVVWLIAGIVPWFYFQDVLIQTTNCLYEYSYLVKKVVFNVNLLPIIKLVSATFSHIFFLIVMFIVMLIAKVPISISWLFVFFYSFLLAILALGISYITSSINVYFKDMAQIVGIILQFGIWMCPIMYDESIFMNSANKIVKLLRFNPIYYIVIGYRNSLLKQEFSVNYILLLIYYILVSIVILYLGYKLFNRLKENFSDVL